VITSTANPRVQAVVRLRKRRARDESGLFVVEGEREVRRALAAGVTVDELWVCPDLRPGGEASIGGPPVTEVGPRVFARVSYRDNPDGVLAVARQFPTDLGRLDPPPHALVLVVAGLEKPGNLGAIVRSAAAAGVDALVVADPVTDVFNPNVVRASQGALFGLPLAVAGGDDVRSWLADRAIPTYAAGPGGTVAHWDLPFDRAAALVVGPEDTGLPAGWFDTAAARVVIPMPGDAGRGVDSLNAAAAAAVLLFEAVRQRAGRR
jgi:TrmH family RNA methyltransferase